MHFTQRCHIKNIAQLLLLNVNFHCLYKSLCALWFEMKLHYWNEGRKNPACARLWWNNTVYPEYTSRSDQFKQKLFFISTNKQILTFFNYCFHFVAIFRFSTTLPFAAKESGNCIQIWTVWFCFTIESDISYASKSWIKFSLSSFIRLFMLISCLVDYLLFSKQVMWNAKKN